MGHMLKLMGNILLAQQEAFLTLMERGTRGGGEEGGTARFTGSQTPVELQLHCHPEPPLFPPVSPLSSPSLPSIALSSFLPFFCSSPTKPPYLLAFITSFRPLHFNSLSSLEKFVFS